ncbi:MAG: primosomal replication protein N [Neisseria sp.]|nr:primosomal replication protein N [Neisseria sp.]
MNNYVCLEATISALDTVRYTPAGIPILGLTLEHASEQEEAQVQRKCRFTIEAKIVGAAAGQTFHIGDTVRCEGFLNVRNPRYPKLQLHIQNIEIIE